MPPANRLVARCHERVPGASVTTAPATTPNQPVFLAHRFAAAGNRDTYTDGNLTDIALGVQGTFGNFDIEAGVRRTSSKLVETGRGFVVKGLATTAINNGTYNIQDPFANSDTVLKSITTTTGRDSVFTQTEVYANATTDLEVLGADETRPVGGLALTLGPVAVRHAVTGYERLDLSTGEVVDRVELTLPPRRWSPGPSGTRCHRR